MGGEKNTTIPGVAGSSALLVCPRKIIVCISLDDVAGMGTSLAEDKDFTIRGGNYELVFTRRKAYWPGGGHT